MMIMMCFASPSSKPYILKGSKDKAFEIFRDIDQTQTGIEKDHAGESGHWTEGKASIGVGRFDELNVKLHKGN